jgi:hypothetical protein|tara:strand:- start:3374 stop:3697 length:324 start_codon:yes stop_codon:yes gene_type:complete
MDALDEYLKTDEERTIETLNKPLEQRAIGIKTKHVRMLRIQCDTCYHKETVNDIFASSVKLGVARCTGNRICSGKMFIIDKSMEHLIKVDTTQIASKKEEDVESWGK